MSEPLTDKEIDDIEQCHRYCTMLSCDHDDIFVLIAEIRRLKADLAKRNEVDTDDWDMETCGELQGEPIGLEWLDEQGQRHVHLYASDVNRGGWFPVAGGWNG